MNVLVNDIVEYLDKKEIDISTFINKYNEKYIVNIFIYDFDKLNFKYKNYLESVMPDSFEIYGIFFNYTKICLNIQCIYYLIMIILME